MRIVAVIPTLNAHETLGLLLQKLNSQSIKLDKVIVVDSSSDDDTAAIAAESSSEVIQINRVDFNHGTTRDIVAKDQDADYVLFMTQDALPADDQLIEKLLAGFRNENVAVSSARQLARSDARITERLIREYNYPDVSGIRNKDDIPKMGIKTFFVSNVCALYDLNVFKRLDGFEHGLKTNEDMLYAAKAVNAGYSIAYCADAVAVHSHNLSFKAQYDRNYIQGYEIARHKELLQNVSLESEGKRLVKYVSKELLKKFKIFSFVQLGIESIYKYLGSKAGRNAGSKCQQ